MLTRTLTPQEYQAITALHAIGPLSGWEWMAAFDTNAIDLITFCTDRHPCGVGADAALLAHWAAGGRCIVHHNHLSGESLSNKDWGALVSQPADEIFAHTDDGSIFQGLIVDRPGMAAALGKWRDATNAADAAFMAAMPPLPNLLNLTNQLSKHLLGSALARRGLATYAYELGPSWSALVAAYPGAIARGVSAAGAVLQTEMPLSAACAGRLRTNLPRVRRR
ncbi:hypothetical protein H8M03_02950 [Sphingomonas sabuli]|uniref:Uncharacterized protein n=1 Tax=Sphingomonas sabuli TaxID=2764186 RepID=A0A7G9L3X1_9SPHN|nr:hypothetical protein [Sphingomonas sabuli]QNM83320.1 hypothetical protein H8M03_02950 [Sphingomonas sabuli]